MTADEDTSSYWRKALRLDEPPSLDISKKCDRHFKLLRAPLRAAARILFDRICPLKTEGTANLPQKAPFIIASNHSSSLDLPAVLLSLPPHHQKNICVIYKSFFDKVPFARMFIKSFVPSFSVDEKGDFLGAMSVAAAALKSGRVLYIAPEGTRSTEDILPFKAGVGALAVETGIKVVPVYIKGTNLALPRGKFFPKRQAIKVVFGPPLESAPYFNKKKTAQAYDVYKEFTDALRAGVVALKEKS